MFGNVNSFENSLFDQFRRMEQQMDNLFGGGSVPNGIRSVARGTYPSVNIGSNADQIDVYLFASGVDPKTLDITIQQNLLSIKGERRSKFDKEVSGYYRKERFEGDFSRVVTLPDDVNPEKVNAAYKDGVLHITIQRRESAKPRQIKVN